MDRRPVLGVDVDGTVWNAWTWACEKIEELTGQKNHWREWTTYTHVYDKYGKQVGDAAFEAAIDHRRLDERDLMPNVREALAKIRLDLGVKIVFVTKNHDPDSMALPLTGWLRRNFGHDVGVCVLSHEEDKLEILRAVRAVGMIDDKGDFIVEVAEAGLWAAAPRQPYNDGMLREHGGVYQFDDWSDVPDALALALSRDEQMRKAISG